MKAMIKIIMIAMIIGMISVNMTIITSNNDNNKRNTIIMSVK